MPFLNDIQGQILEQLGYYQYLSAEQVSRLTTRSLGYIRAQLATLSHRKYIASYHVVVTAKIRAANIYYLTTDGRDILLQFDKAFTNVRIPKNYAPVVVRDYFHRLHYTDLVISLVEHFRSMGITLSLFLSYYDKSGDNRTQKNGALQSQTKISLGEHGYFMPDGVMITKQPDGSRTLYLLELYNGKDTGRVIQQLAQHARSIKLGAASKRFSIAANPFVLCAFEQDGCRQAVIKRLLQNEKFSKIKHLFFFASLDEVKKNCDKAWHSISGELLSFT